MNQILPPETKNIIIKNFKCPLNNDIVFDANIKMVVLKTTDGQIEYRFHAPIPLACDAYFKRDNNLNFTPEQCGKACPTELKKHFF